MSHVDSVSSREQTSQKSGNRESWRSCPESYRQRTGMRQQCYAPRTCQRKRITSTSSRWPTVRRWTSYAPRCRLRKLAAPSTSVSHPYASSESQTVGRNRRFDDLSCRELPATAQEAKGSGTVALRAARVIDGTGAAPIQNGVVVVTDDKIVAVGQQGASLSRRRAHDRSRRRDAAAGLHRRAHAHHRATLNDPQASAAVQRLRGVWARSSASPTRERRCWPASRRFATSARRTSTTWRCAKRSTTARDRAAHAERRTRASASPAATATRTASSPVSRTATRRPASPTGRIRFAPRSAIR